MDASKYRFESHSFGKGRLVLAVIRRYAALHPATTIAKLQQAFPKHCQGSHEIVATVEQANEVYTSTARKRHFLNPEEVIQLLDGAVAISNQWGIKNINGFIEQARKLKFTIDIV